MIVGGQTINNMSDKLKGRNFALAIDKSGSMSTNDCPGGKSRWDYAQEQSLAIANECHKHDPDGIDVYVFATKTKAYPNTTPDTVVKVFGENSPGNSTDTAGMLKTIFDKFNAAKKTGDKTPLTVVVITDGAPDDQKAVDKVIIDQANSLDEDGELGITFVQIGKDAGARTFLKHLDDDLKGLGAKFDIVDTKNVDEMEEMSIVQLLEEAVED